MGEVYDQIKVSQSSASEHNVKSKVSQWLMT